MVRNFSEAEVEVLSVASLMVLSACAVALSEVLPVHAERKRRERKRKEGFMMFAFWFFTNDGLSIYKKTFYVLPTVAFISILSVATHRLPLQKKYSLFRENRK